LVWPGSQTFGRREISTFPENVRMVMEVMPSAAGKRGIVPAKHRTSRIRPFLARISGVLLERVCLFIPHRPHSVGAEHPKGDTAAPNQFFHRNPTTLKDRAQLKRAHLEHRQVINRGRWL